jgi:DNA uptake protein ComE-like DNA-binding protein
MTRLRSLGGVALLALALAACGGAATQAPATTVAPTQASADAPTAVPAADAPTAVPAADAPTAAPAVATTKLNLNTLTGDQLMATIPNFSQRMVREFQEYRPYVSILQFRKEIGKYVDQSQVAEWEKYVYVPVDYNQSDTATLQQLPGVTAAVADQLIAARPYSSSEAFLDKLGSLTSAADSQQASAYLASQ